ncbi:MAG: DUF5673 domain-containing protein [Patescibacteria group bacterium]|nr:DUF5673 domain-containing protein [Patescibacteria group bacterium]
MEKQHGKILASWEMQDFDKYKKSILWYVIAVIAGMSMLVYAIFTANFLFAVIVLMFAIIILLHDLRSPRKIKCGITESGILLGERIYKWSEFENFWILYEPPELKNLYLELKGVRPRITVSLEKQNPNRIREILNKYLMEELEREDEPLTEYVGRVLKI